MLRPLRNNIGSYSDSILRPPRTRILQPHTTTVKTWKLRIRTNPEAVPPTSRPSDFRRSVHGRLRLWFGICVARSHCGCVCTAGNPYPCEPFTSCQNSTSPFPNPQPDKPGRTQELQPGACPKKTWIVLTLVSGLQEHSPGPGLGQVFGPGVGTG